MRMLESMLSVTFSVHFLVISEFCRSRSDFNFKLKSPGHLSADSSNLVQFLPIRLVKPHLQSHLTSCFFGFE